jgi:hypothetical protein
MATSGSCETDKYNSKKCVVFNWSRKSYVNNSSECKSTIYFEVKGKGASGYHYAGPIKVYINKNSGTPNYTFWASRGQLYDGTFVGSGEFTIDHNKSSGAGSFWVYIEAAIYTNAVNCYGSGSWNLDTLPRNVNITSFSVSKRDETSVTYSYGVDATCDYAWYSKDNGGSWHSLPNTGIVSGLDANTSYNFKLRVRRADSQLTTDSGTYSQTTYDYPKPTSVNNFIIGDGASVTLYNPLKRNCTLDIISNNSGTVIGTYSGTYAGVVNAEFKTEDAINKQYASIPNSRSGTYYARVTYGNSVKTLGTGTYEIKGTELPTFANFTYRDELKESINLTGNNQIIINNYNNIKIIIPSEYKASGNNSASIKKYRAVCGNLADEQPYSDDSEVILNLGCIKDRTITVYAIDSRDVSTPALMSISNDNWKEYTDILIHSALMERTDGIGTTVTLKFQGTIWDNTFGKEDNEITSCKYRYKKSNEIDYTVEPIDIIPIRTEDSFSFNSTIQGDIGTNGFNASNSFNVQIIISDKIRTTTYETLLGAGTPAMAIHPNGVAFGAPYDENEGGSCQVGGKSLLNLVYPIGSIYMSINNIEPSILFGGSWERISQGRFLIGVKENSAFAENNIPDFGTTAGNKGYLFAPEDKGGEYKNTLEFENYSSYVYSTRADFEKNDLTKNWFPPDGAWGIGSVYTKNKNTPHNNMPPYFAVYMWKRIA